MVLAAISSFPRSRPLPCPALSWTVIYTAFFVLYFVLTRLSLLGFSHYLVLVWLCLVGIGLELGCCLRLHHAAGWAIPLVIETWFPLAVFTPEASLI